MRILIVEKDGELRLVYTKALQRAGYEVTGVWDNKSAVELASARQFDLVVSEDGDFVLTRLHELGVSMLVVLLKKPLSARTLVATVKEVIP